MPADAVGLLTIAMNRGLFMPQGLPQRDKPCPGTGADRMQRGSAPGSSCSGVEVSQISTTVRRASARGAYRQPLAEGL